MPRPLSLLCLAGLLAAACATCPNYCSSHGTCSFDEQMTCTCFEGWTGPDCSLRTCPYGVQWTGFSQTTDGLHSQQAECGNMVRCVVHRCVLRRVASCGLGSPP